MREIDLGWVFSGIGSPSALGVRRDERESVEKYCKQPISWWLECGSDKGSNYEILL